MTVFLVRHLTKYRYRRPVRLGEHRLLFRPRDSFDERLLHSQLLISPQPLRLNDANQLPGLHSCIRGQCDDPDDSLQRWLLGFLEFGRSQPTGRVLMTLNEAIADGFSYVRRIASGTQAPVKTLRSRKGTCRDFALLMMEAARSVGFAARFVTGYIYVPDRDGRGWLGGGSTHAWCQIYLPGSGWVEFDPTNGIVGNRDLIRVAVARNPEQAVPLSGTYWGDRHDELAMEIEVNVKAEPSINQK
jgi:transglutaminase-like putative cysteine protease